MRPAAPRPPAVVAPLPGAPRAAPASSPGAVIVLEAPPGAPLSDPASAPPRFVLLEDGQVFVGGTARLEAGRLEKGEAQALRKRAEAVRKLPGLGERVVLGGDPARTCGLRLLDDKPFEVVVAGDPARRRRTSRRSPPSSPTSCGSTTRACGPYAPARLRDGRARGPPRRGLPPVGLHLPDRGGPRRPAPRLARGGRGLADRRGARLRLRDDRPSPAQAAATSSPSARSSPASSRSRRAPRRRASPGL